MDGKPYYIETKYDGERMLLHKNEDEFKYFSRRWVVWYKFMVLWRSYNSYVIYMEYLLCLYSVIYYTST